VLVRLYAVAQLVEALRYKTEDRGFGTRLEFFIELILPAMHYGPVFDSVSNRNEYQESFLGG
jgi:hypothetical protein